VELSGVSHRYDADPVLQDVTFQVAAGESVALLGPSGCGKTTLLRAIAGLEQPAVGTIRLGGTEVCGPRAWIAPERRRVGMVFQDWALFPHLSVAANVAYGLRRGSQAARRVAESLEMVGLSGYDDRLPTTLSGGQQQRVAVARALAPRPQVLLLDEPFSNLDTNMRVEVRAEVHRLLLELGITAVFVTHDQEEAFVVGDRVAVMGEGRIVQVGTPQEIYAAPATRWVAEFVGDALFIPGEATGLEATGPLGLLPLEAEHTGAVDVLVRPEQLAIVGGDDATVEMVEFHGHDAVVFVTLAGQSLRVRTGPQVAVRRGDIVGLTFTGTAARAFTPAEHP
jgi:iron(III) transport system ATP-binding protein